MNTYDFDETIYIRDSSVTFYLYCLKRYPSAILRTVPRTVFMGAKKALGKIDMTALKEQLFSFVRYIDAERVVDDFWKEKFDGVGEWYLAQKKDDDIIISASPEFLLRPAADKLGVRLIATRMDSKTGRITGKNCHDVEKVRRFHEQYPGAHTECFYSDSLSDTPMAELADRAFLVTRGRLSPWPNK